MFYEEKVIGGLLWCRTTPDGEWRKATGDNAAAVNALLVLPDAERVRVFSHFCTSCGRDNPACQCWNDE